MSMEFLNFQNMTSIENENKGVFARFYDKAVKTGNILKNGLPEFEQKLYIEIKIRDERDVFDQPATQEHIKRFSAEYNRYLTEKEKKKQGTSLKLFSFLSSDQIESCYFRGIFSVEDLSALSDEAAQNLGLSEEKELGKMFLNASKNNKFLSQMRQKEKEYILKIQKLKEEIERLKQNEQEKLPNKS